MNMMSRRLQRLLDLLFFTNSWFTCKGYKPVEARIRSTLRCNSQCRYCALGQQKVDSQLSEMSTEQFFIVFDKLRKYGTKRLSFLGGEPTLRRDLPELVSYAKKCGFFVSLITNGYIVTKDLAEKLARAGVDVVTFSLDSAAPDVHDHLRGLEGGWKKATDGLAFLNHFRRKYESPIKIHVNTVISKINFKALSTILDMKTFLNFDSITFSPLEDFIGSGLELTVDEVKYFNKYVAPEIENKARVYNVQTDAYPFGKEEVLTSQNDRPINIYKSTYCFMPWVYIDIMPNGDVIPCSCAGLDMVMGNLLKQPFLEVWNGKEYVEFRRRCRPPSFKMCSRCWCYLNNNMSLMRNYRRVPGPLRRILEFMS